jgi:hypothetical protein
LIKHNNIKHLGLCKSITMPPKKSTETKATAKDEEKTGTSKSDFKKEAKSNVKVEPKVKDEPNIKPSPHHEKQPAIKMESADEGAENVAYHSVPEHTPKTFKPRRALTMNTDHRDGPHAPPPFGERDYARKLKADALIAKRDSNSPLKSEEEKKAGIAQIPKVPGGWVYAGEGVTAEESRVVAKGKNGGAKFPWVSIITMKKYVPSSHSQSIVQPNLQVRGEPIEYHHHEHRTAYLVVSGGGIAILSKKDGMPAFDSSESAISGVLDKQSEVFIVLKNTKYRIGLQFKTVKYVEGHEVLDAATRDLWIVSGEIEWDDAVGSHAVGKVTREVVDGGDVSGRVMAAWQAAKQDHPAWKALLEERREIDATFKHRGDRTDVIQRDGDNGSPLNFSENDEPEPFGLDSDVSEKGKDAGTAKEKDESKKAIKKEEDPKKERGTRGRSVRVKK